MSMEDRHSFSDPRPIDGLDLPTWDVDVFRDGVLDPILTLRINATNLPPRKSKKKKVAWKLPDSVKGSPRFGVDEKRRLLELFKNVKKQRRKEKLRTNGGTLGNDNISDNNNRNDTTANNNEGSDDGGDHVKKNQQEANDEGDNNEYIMDEKEKSASTKIVTNGKELINKSINNIKSAAGGMQAITNAQDQFGKISLRAQKIDDNLTGKPLPVEKDPILKTNDDIHHTAPPIPQASRPLPTAPPPGFGGKCSGNAAISSSSILRDKPPSASHGVPLPSTRPQENKKKQEKKQHHHISSSPRETSSFLYSAPDAIPQAKHKQHQQPAFPPRMNSVPPKRLNTDLSSKDKRPPLAAAVAASSTLPRPGLQKQKPPPHQSLHPPSNKSVSYGLQQQKSFHPHPPSSQNTQQEEQHRKSSSSPSHHSAGGRCFVLSRDNYQLSAQHVTKVYYSLIMQGRVEELLSYYAPSAQKSLSLKSAHAVCVDANQMRAQLQSLAGSSFAVDGILVQLGIESTILLVLTGSCIMPQLKESLHFCHTMILSRMNSGTASANTKNETTSVEVPTTPPVDNYQIHNDALVLLTKE